MAMGLVDTIMVGHLGTAELAATAMANSFFFTIYVGFLGLLDALTPLISQAIGSGERRKTGVLLWQGIVLALVCGPPLTVLFLNSSDLLGFLGQAPEVVKGASTYLMARSLGVLPHALFGAHRAFLNGVEKTDRVFRIVIAANLVNLIANQILIFGLGPIPALGVAGAGYATSISVTALFLGAAWEVHGGAYEDYGVTPSSPDPSLLRSIFSLGWPMSAQYTLEVSVFSMITVFVGWMGPEVLSAHQVGMSLQGLAFAVAQGISTGAMVRTGEAFGRGDRAGVIQAGRLSMGLTGCVMGFVAMLYLGIPRTLAGAYTSDPVVLERAASLLWISAILGLFDGLQLIAGACLRATSDSQTPFWAHLTAYWCLGLPLGYWLAFSQNWGLEGFWWGLTLALAVIALVLTRTFLHEGWVRRLPVAT
jgi:MATE family multidrug resistance protein